MQNQIEVDKKLNFSLPDPNGPFKVALQQWLVNAIKMGSRTHRKGLENQNKGLDKGLVAVDSSISAFGMVQGGDASIGRGAQNLACLLQPCRCLESSQIACHLGSGLEEIKIEEDIVQSALESYDVGTCTLGQEMGYCLLTHLSNP